MTMWWETSSDDSYPRQQDIINSPFQNISGQSPPPSATAAAQRPAYTAAANAAIIVFTSVVVAVVAVLTVADLEEDDRALLRN